MSQSLRMLAALLVSFSCFTGCGGGGDENQVIQPTENYQLTEQEKKNAEQGGEKTDFTGN